MSDTRTPEPALDPTSDDFASEAEILLDDPEMQQVLAQYDNQVQEADNAANPSPPKDDDGFSPWQWVKKKFSQTAVPFTRPEGTPSLSGLVTGESSEPTSLLDKATQTLGKVDQAITRGVAQAGNELGKTALELGGGLINATRAYKVLDDKGEDEFRKWWAKSSTDWAEEGRGVGGALLASKAHMDKWAGPKRDGVYGFVEGVSQFAAGFATGGAALKGLKAVPMVGKAATALDNTSIAKATITGGIADIAFFDPYEKRLSNMLTEGPNWFSGPIQEYIASPLKKGVSVLKSDADDGKAVARIKAGLEGYMTGFAIDRVIFAAKLLKRKVSNGEPIDASSKASSAELEEIKEEFAHLFKDSDEPAVAEGNIVSVGSVDVPEQATAPAQAPTPVGSIDELEPDSARVLILDDGKKVIRGTQSLPDGTSKSFDIPLDLSNEKATLDAMRDLRKRAGNLEVDNKVMDGLSQEEWKLVTDGMGTGGHAQISAGKAVGSADKTAAGKTPRAANGNRYQELSRSAPSPAHAEIEAAAFNLATKNVMKTGGQFFGPEQQTAFFEALQGYQKGGDGRQVAEVLEAFGYNPGYIQQPEHVVNQLKSMVDAAPEASLIARGKGMSDDELRKAAIEIFPDLSDAGALKHAEEMFGGTQRLPEMMVALKSWMWYQAKQINKLTRLTTEFPENALVADQHMAALNTLVQVHAHTTGSMTKAAQTVRSGAMPLGELTEKLTAVRKDINAQGMDGDAATHVKEAPGAEAPTAHKGEPTAPVADQGKLSIAEKLNNAVKQGQLKHRAPGTYDVAKSLTRGEIMALSRQIQMAEGNLEGMLKLINGPKQADLAMHPNVPPEVKRNWGKFVNTYRAEAMLSGMTTQISNVVSNAGLAVKRPLQYYWAGVESGNKELADEGADMMAGLFLHWWESAKIATKAFKEGKNFFDAGSSTMEQHAGDLLSLERASVKHGAEAVGAGMHIAARMPSRMLLSEDEFFKQLSGRAYTRAQVLKQARKEGITDPKALTQRVQDSMKVAFDPDQGAVFPAAIEYAKDVTFTKDLGPVAKKASDFIQSNEFTKFILPFFKTPTNVFHHAWEEAPALNLLNKQMVEDLNAGGQRAALARAKADFGATMYGMAAWLALSGKITGAGPKDPELRKQWMAAGNQPYSIRLAGGQFSYRKGDPFTTSLGMAADLISYSGEMDENTKVSLAAVVTTTIASNIVGKTPMLSGASDFLDAISSGDAKEAEKWLSGAVSSTVVPNALSKANSDEYVREARSIFDRTLARIPGASETLPAQRNIFGEKVLKAPGWSNRFFNPFTFMKAPKSDDMAVELLKLGKALPMPAETWADGRIDLADATGLYAADRKGQAPYDRWLEMMTAPPWGGPPLREMVEELVHSDAYKQLKGENAWGPGGSRHMLVSEMIRSYQDAGKGQLLKEYPTLLQDLIKHDASSAAGLIGGKDGAMEMKDKVEQMFRLPQSQAPAP